ncbi:hypothetical protein P8S54_00465 [Thiomicrospira sp. R3]|uniref:hypothetical protein n=1 Tax=Thiomicrospira sp. R3 TaxID=3035472 RepID=UPI00259BED9C|nr:hypothetical protein [Thiomicrospira sp. R3]WFE68805.1 hypothetical protein P8S54_00465 [Thiomicrospira sp. R3]
MSDDVIVPVPVYTKPSNMFLASNNLLNITDKQLVVAYIGRAVDWKMFPLKKMVDDLTVLKKTARVIVYTNDASCFSDFIGSTDAKIQLEFKEGYWGDKLAQDILCNKVNLGYAMGTAALDLANLGIPTILADFSTAEFPENYTYRFLYQASKGNLGINVCENDHTDRRTLSDIVGDFNLRAESEKSYNYVSKNHDIDNIAKKIIIVSKNSNMDLGYLSKPGALIYFLLYLLKRVFRKDNKYFGWGIK